MISIVILEALFSGFCFCRDRPDVLIPILRSWALFVFAPNLFFATSAQSLLAALNLQIVSKKSISESSATTTGP